MSVKNLKKYIEKAVQNTFESLNDVVATMNTSKIFAGLMILTLNITSKFVTIKLGKTMESYFKYTFSKQILVFAMAWMGTRDIYIALIISILFIIFSDYLLHEESPFCCLPDSFKNYHLNLLENDQVSDEEIKKAQEILDKATRQKNANSDISVDNPLSLDKKSLSNQQKMQQVLY
jgi:hypothetical protein